MILAGGDESKQNSCDINVIFPEKLLEQGDPLIAVDRLRQDPPLMFEDIYKYPAGTASCVWYSLPKNIF